MKTIKIKTLLFSGVLLMTMSLTTFAQTSADTQKTIGRKHHKLAQAPDLSNNKEVVNSEASIFEAGSSAQVRHDRIGSLCPGGVSNVGKNSVKSRYPNPSKELNGIPQ